MAYAELVKFIDGELQNKDDLALTEGQLQSIKEWARKVPIREQAAYLEVLENLNGQGLLFYLSKIVPGFSGRRE